MAATMPAGQQHFHHNQRSPQHPQPHQPPRSPLGAGRYEDQIVSSNTGSLNSDFDPIKDAQDTAEDSSILKRFKILNLVGTGNYARVYRGVTPAGRELAIKAINLSKTSENYRCKFLPRELTILRKISHANICKIHEIIRVSDRVFIVMQFCNRGTIADLLHKLGPLSEPMARHLFAPTIDAVVYLHSLDFAHRDLKVENILLDNDFNPKLTDFSYSCHTSVENSAKTKNGSKGSNYSSQAQRLLSHSLPRMAIRSPRGSPFAHARSPTPSFSSPRPSPPQQVAPEPTRGVHNSASTRLNETFCGTLPYLSPEMIKQSPYDPKKTDVWSLGVCLYVMLNDRLPFPFTDVKQMLKKQLARDYKFKALMEFSEPAKEIVAQMLEPEFAKRPSANEVSKLQWMNGPKEKPH